MTTIEIIFWAIFGIILYVYIGYPVLLRVLVFLKELVMPRHRLNLPEKLPTVTLFITAFDQEELVDKKMLNSLALNYPRELLTIMWVTDGSTDSTNRKILEYPQARLQYSPVYKGKCAAMNRAMQFVKSDITIFSDPSAMLNTEAVNEMVKQFTRSNVGCVVGGEKRKIYLNNEENLASEGEYAYQKYDSVIRDLNSRLYSALGTSWGEMYAIRTEMFHPMLLDTMMDDLSMSVKIALDGKITAYAPGAYATGEISSDASQVQERVVRQAAGNLQAMSRFRKIIFNPMNNILLFFEYLSHRVLRWAIVPVLAIILMPLNIAAVIFAPDTVNIAVLALLTAFNAAAYTGYIMSKKKMRKIKLFRIPYYFWFMNLNAFRGYAYLKQRKVSPMWKRTKRAYF